LPFRYATFFGDYASASEAQPPGSILICPVRPSLTARSCGQAATDDLQDSESNLPYIILSKIPAAPMPPPTHMVTIP